MKVLARKGRRAPRRVAVVAPRSRDTSPNRLSTTPPRANFQFIGGSLAIDFVNTVGDRLNRSTRRDYFRSIEDLLAWMESAGFAGANAAPRRASAHALRRALSLRERLYRIFAALAAGSTPSDGDLRGLSRGVAAVFARRRLASKPGIVWLWQPSTPALDRAIGEIVLDAASLVTSSRRMQIKRCADARCGWLFVDQSNAGRRRWCSMTDCGNRAKARRHYERMRRS